MTRTATATATTTTAAVRAGAPQERKAPRGMIRLFNPLALRLAGTRLLPLWGVLEHRGRRTGTAFRTPVVVRPVADGFLVPMPWGERTDWYRNVCAAANHGNLLLTAFSSRCNC